MAFKKQASMKDSRSILYVNFSPYENAGKILDFLVSEFANVIVFSFNFHRLGINQKPGALQIFKNSKLITSHPLFQMSFRPPLVFLLASTKILQVT